MAEKVVIADIEINLEQAIQDAVKMREEIERLKEQTNKLRETQGTTNAEYVMSSANLKAAQEQLRQQEQMISKVTVSQNANIGSLAQMKAELAVVTARWNQLSKSERLNSEEGKMLAKRKLELTNALKKEEIATGDARRNVGNYHAEIEKATSVINRLIPGFGSASSGAQMLGNAFKLMLGPVGLIIAAIASLVAYFKRTEEGQDRLQKITAIFNVVLKNFLDIVSAVGEALYNAFTRPKESIEKLKQWINDVGVFFQNTFGNIIGGSIDVFVSWIEKGFAKVGLAWQRLKNVFVDNSDKIERAQQNIIDKNKDLENAHNRVKEGTKNLTTAIKNGYNSLKEALKSYIDENLKEAAIAARIANEKAALRRRERAEIINDAKESAKIAELRAEAAKKDKYSGEERLKMLEQAIALENKMMSDDLEIAKIKARIHKEEMQMSANTHEDYEEQARLEAEVYKIMAENAEKRRGFEKQRQSAINDMLEDNRKVAIQAIEQMQYELESWQIMNRDKLDITGEYVKRQQEILRKNLEIKISEIDAKENESEAAKNAEKLKLQNEYNLNIQKLNADFEDAEKTRRLEVLQTNYDNELALFQDSILQKLDVQRQALEWQYQQEIEAAEKIGADTTLIEEKYKQAQIEISRAERDAKLSLAQDFANNIATIFGEQTAVGKAAAVAATTIDTFRAAMAAYTGMVSAIPGPVGIAAGVVAAAASVATGIANVKKILAVKSGLPGDKGVSASGMTASGTSVPTKQASVNAEIGKGIISRETIVKQSENNLQLQPTLVVDDVTSKQKQTNNISKTSTL